MSPTRRRSALRDDSGVAMITAIAVAGLVAILCVTLLTITLAETRGSGRERQRAAAVAFAEGQVDTTLALIQAAAPASLPCTGTAQSTGLGPDTINAATTVTYYNATGATMSCSSTTGVAATAKSALVRTTATSVALAGAAPAVRTVESLVNLSPSTTPGGLDKAIFAQGNLALNNNGEVFGTGGLPNADLYTNSNFACNNNQDYHGSIFAQGTITMSSTCTVDVNAWAGTGFTATNTGVTVKGDVRVGNGNANMDAKGATVAGKVTTKGSIIGSAWRGDNCPAKCTEGASPGMPPAQAFPQLPWTGTVRAAWAAAPPVGGNYNNVVEITTGCGYDSTAKASKAGAWIMANAATLTQPTILYSSCPEGVLIEKNNNDLLLGNNLAVFADGGFKIANSLTISSTTTAQRNLYLIHPSNAPSCGLYNGIQLDNQVKLLPTVDMMLYSKCNIVKANNADHFGQIYGGGTVSIDNSFTMYYKPVPMFGITNPPTSTTGYTLDMVYKRENSG